MSSALDLHVSSFINDPTPFLARPLLNSTPSEFRLGVLTSLTILAVTDLALSLVNILHATHEFSADRYSTRRIAHDLLSLSFLSIFKLLSRLFRVTSVSLSLPGPSASRARMFTRLGIASLIFFVALGADIAAIVFTAQTSRMLQVGDGKKLVVSFRDDNSEAAITDDGELAKSRTYPLVLNGFDDFLQAQALIVTSDLVFNEGEKKGDRKLESTDATIVVGYGNEGKPSDRQRSAVVSILKAGFGYTSKTRLDLALPGGDYDSASLIFDMDDGRQARNAGYLNDLLEKAGCEREGIFAVGADKESVDNSGVSHGYACRLENFDDVNNLDNTVGSVRNHFLSSLRVDLVPGESAFIVRPMSDASLKEEAMPVFVGTVLRRALGELGLLIILAVVVASRFILGFISSDEEDFIVLSALKEVSGVACNLGYLSVPSFFLSNKLSCDKDQNYHFGVLNPAGFEVLNPAGFEVLNPAGFEVV